MSVAWTPDKDDVVSKDTLESIVDAFGGTYIESGCGVIPDPDQVTNDNVINVGTGDYYINGVKYNIAITKTLDLTSNLPSTGGEKRYVIITIDTGGTVSAENCTIHATSPEIDFTSSNIANECKLATILLTGGQIAVNSADIKDWSRIHHDTSLAEIDEITASSTEINVLDGVTGGTITASKGVVLDSNSKVNQWNVDNIRIDGNVISSQNTNGSIQLLPNGTGQINLGNSNNNVYIGKLADAGVDTDKFLVGDSSNYIRYRTGAEVLSDIGGLSSGTIEDYVWKGSGNSGYVMLTPVFDGDNGALNTDGTWAYNDNTYLRLNIPLPLAKGSENLYITELRVETSATDPSAVSVLNSWLYKVSASATPSIHDSTTTDLFVGPQTWDHSDLSLSGNLSAYYVLQMNAEAGSKFISARAKFYYE